MAFSGWKKFFIDGNIEEGSDVDVANKRASWSRGRLSDIEAVEAGAWGRMVRIVGEVPGEFWQSDDLWLAVASEKGGLTRRRIQRLLGVGEVFLTVEKTVKYIVAKVSRKPPPTVYSQIVHVLDISSKLGLWLTLEIDGTTNLNSLSFYPARR